MVSQDVLFFILVAMFLICLCAVLVHWSLLAKQALEKGRMRLENGFNGLERDI